MDWRDQDVIVKMIVTLMHLDVVRQKDMNNEEYKCFLRHAMAFGKRWGRYDSDS